MPSMSKTENYESPNLIHGCFASLSINVKSHPILIEHNSMQKNTFLEICRRENC